MIPGIARLLFKTFSVVPVSPRYPLLATTGNGGAVCINVNWDTVRRREWAIQIIGPNVLGGVSCNQFVVYERQIGTVKSAFDTEITDESAHFSVDSLITSSSSIASGYAGWQLHIRPSEYLGFESGTSIFPITSNTDYSIVVSGGLLVVTAPGDMYAVERRQPMVGKVLRTITTANVTSSAVFPVANSASFQVGDLVHATDQVNDYRLTVTSVTTGSITVSGPATLSSGATVDFVWQSADGSVQFSVADGTVPFSPVADQFYVDTFPQASDIALRPENFPLFDVNSLNINTIGGV